MTQLIWIDLETTGLAPRVDSILEIAIKVADLRDPFNAEPLINLVLLGDAYPHVEQYVRDMHTNNGLWDECRKSHISTVDVEHQLLRHFPPTGRDEMPILAGSSVHFDHSFLQYYMPTLASRFSHRHYDVSAVKLFCESLGMPKLPKISAHRAMSDIDVSIADARKCAEWSNHNELDRVATELQHAFPKMERSSALLKAADMIRLRLR